MTARVTLILVLAGVLVGPTAPAYAVSWPQRQQAISAFDSDPQKTVTADCPGGTYVYASGARLSDGHNGVIITGMVPNADHSSVTVRAAARAAQVGDWSVTAYAVCDIPGRFTPPQRVTAIGTSTATASCPDGKKVFGTGYQVNASPDDAYIIRVVPNEELTEVTVQAGGPLATSTTVTAIAVCAGIGWLDYTYLATRTDGSLTSGPQLVTATADFDSLQLYGVGGAVHSFLVAGTLDALVPVLSTNTAYVRGTPLGPTAQPYPALNSVSALTVIGGDVTAYAIMIGTYY